MTVHWPIYEETLEAVVRSTLESEGRKSDLALLLERTEAKVAHTQDQTRSKRRQMIRWSVAAGIATVGAGAQFFLWSTNASAHSLVQSVSENLSRGVDRCFDVELSVPSGWPLLSSTHPIRIWTRGDRYRVEMNLNGRIVTWGCDEEHRLWVACGPELGLLFEAKEIPRRMAVALNHLHLDVGQLAGDLLSGYDLQYDSNRRRARGKATVIATAKNGKSIFRYQRAVLEIDVATKTIQSLELDQSVKGRENARCHFTFLESSLQSDDSYWLSSYINPDATVLDRKRSKDRMQELMDLVRGR